ncbi:Ig-like domain-containing protein [Arundinibacter roseus]|nr:SdrD B-like domain-containing protein [Arundinibacter roseus]
MRKLYSLLRKKIKKPIFYFLLICSINHLTVAQTCPAPADFNLLTPCYVNGSRTASPNDDVIVLFNHTTARGTSATKQVVASYSEVGTVWGLAWHAQTKKLYAAAFLKRHCDLSPDGLGAIYEIDLTTPTTAGAGTPTLWMDLNSTTHLGAGATLFPSETAANRGLGGILEPSHDIWAFSRVGKEGLGDIEISADGNTMYVMDLTNRQVLEINMSTKTVTNRYAITAPSGYPNAEDRRPFAIKHHKGELYIGMVGSGESSYNSSNTNQNKIDLRGTILKLSGTSFSTVFTIDSLGVADPTDPAATHKYTSYRGNPNFGSGLGWYGYFTTDIAPSYGLTNPNAFIQHPVPLISDIEFDKNDNMVIGIMDWSAHRYGNANYIPNTSNTTNLKSVQAHGDVIKAVKSGSSWVKEAALGRFYDDMQAIPNPAPSGWPRDTYMGGMIVTDCNGTELVVANMQDPYTTNEGGVVWMRTSDGFMQTSTAPPASPTNSANAINASRLRVYWGTGGTSDSFGKANGLGDMVATFSVACANPTISAQATDPTCTVAGKIDLVSVTGGDKYGISLGTTYTGPVYASATALPSTLPSAIKSAISNGADSVFTIRVFNAANDCFKDTTVTVKAVPTNCATKPTGWDFTCESGIMVETVGKAGFGVSNPTVNCTGSGTATITLSNGASADSIYVEAVYKTTNPGPSVTFVANSTNYVAFRYQLPLLGDAWVYRTKVPATASISLTDGTKFCALQSLVAYVFRKQTGMASTGVFTCEQGFQNTVTVNLPLPTLTKPADVTVCVPISELTNDGRLLQIKVTAGTIVKDTTITGSDPAFGTCCLAIPKLKLVNVPVGTTTVKVEIISPISPAGQSFTVASAISANVECEKCVKPVAVVNPKTQTICIGGTATAFTATPATGVEYNWFGPLADTTSAALGSSIATTSSFTPTGAALATAGTKYYAVVVNTTGEPTCADTAFVILTVNPLPTPTVNSPEICVGESATLTVTNCAGTVTWNDATTGLIKTVSPAVTTTYTATCLVNGCEGETTATVTVKPQPEITSSGNPVCASDLTTYTVNFTATAGATVTADKGTVSGSSVTGVPSGETVRIIAELDGCSDTLTVTFNCECPVVTPPVPSATPATICLGESSVLSATGCTAGTVTWFTDAGLTTPLSNLTVSPTATTTYYAVCTITASGCASQAAPVTVTVNPLPTPTVNSPEICVGESATLTVTNCAGTVTWNDATTGLIKTVSPAVTTTYTATCLVNGCEGETTATVTVKPQPEITSSGNPVCASDLTTYTVNFTATAGATITANLGTVSGSSVTGVPSGETVRIIAELDGCSDTLTVTFNCECPVVTPPVPSATPATICVGESSVLSATGCAAGTVTWFTDAGLTTPLSNLTVSPTATTTYYAVCTITASGCASQAAPVTVTVNPLPTPSVNSPEICVGESATLTVTNCAGTVTWNDATTGLIKTVSPAVTTTYTATCLVNGCEGETTATVTVKPQPEITSSGNPVCASDLTTYTVNFTATAGATVTADKGTVSGSSVTGVPSGETVRIIAELDGCSDTLTVTFNCECPVVTPPVPSATPATICLGESSVLSATGCTAGTVTWFTDAGLTTPLSNLTVSPTTTTTYYAVCTITASGCASQAAPVTVTVNPLPTPTVNSPEICIGESATLTVTNCAGTVTWNDATTGLIKTVSPAVTTTYTATCLVNGCEGEAIATVTVKPQPSITVTGTTCNVAGTTFDVTFTATAGALVTADKGTVSGNSVTGVPSGETVKIIVTLDGCKDSTTTTQNCLVPTGSLGDFVWKDLNDNGQQDAGEPGVNGVKVILWSAVGGAPGAKLDSTTTAGNGAYSFTNLGKGDYIVQIDVTTLPDSCLISPKQNIGNDASDNDFTTAGLSPVVTLDPTLTGLNKDNPTIDAGLISPCVAPTFAATDASAATCDGKTAQNDASFVVTGISDGNKFSFATSVAGLANYASATALTGSTITVANLPNPVQTTGQTYIVRIFNGKDDCFTDVSILVPYRDCADVCVKPDAGPAQVFVCHPATSVNLPDAAAGEEWISAATNPVSVSIAAQTGVVSGMNENGVYLFILRDATLGSTCSDTVVVFRGVLELPDQTTCFDTLTLPAVAGATWTAAAGNPAMITTDGKISGMATKDFTYSFIISNGNCSDTIVVTRLNCDKVYDLALDKAIDKNLAMLGETLTYTIRVWNEGEATAHGIEVTDELNAGVQYLSSTADIGSYSQLTKKWSFDSLMVGDTVSLQIRVKVIAAGVWFNTAEITKMTEDDVDSTPGNGDETEDDIDRECFTVPVLLCKGAGSSLELSVPLQYTGVVWFRKTQGGQPVQVAMGNSYTATETELGSYEYTYTSTSGTCPAEGCCPIILVVEDCCPAEICVPFTVRKVKK